MTFVVDFRAHILHKERWWVINWGSTSIFRVCFPSHVLFWIGTTMFFGLGRFVCSLGSLSIIGSGSILLVHQADVIIYWLHSIFQTSLVLFCYLAIAVCIIFLSDKAIFDNLINVFSSNWLLQELHLYIAQIRNILASFRNQSILWIIILLGIQVVGVPPVVNYFKYGMWSKRVVLIINRNGWVGIWLFEYLWINLNTCLVKLLMICRFSLLL